jgi:formylglycine-generating enzyme required for sulfatase activity
MVKKDETVNTGGGAYIGGDVHVHNGDFVGRDQGDQGSEPAVDLDSPAMQAARQRYRVELRRRYGVIETHAFTALAEDERVGQPLRLPLLGEHGVYVPLTFEATHAREDALPQRLRDKTRDPEAPAGQSLALAEVLRCPGHLAIIGDAGSGKTTALHVLVSLLAAEQPAALDRDLAAALPQPVPLPVLLPLRFFEHACNAEHGDYDRCAADLLRFVDPWFNKWCPQANLPLGFLSAHVRSGRAWFLLDALDEVADASNREAIRNVIEGLARSLNGTRLIVTARIAAYRATSLNEDFTVVTIRDLDADQRAHLGHAIYRGLALPDAATRAEDLLQRLENNPALRALARTPVMVWTAAVIHALRGELPEGRAALYDAYVNILLKKSFERTRYDTAALDTLTNGLGWTESNRRHYLTYMAFKTHELLETQRERQGEAIVIGEDELVDGILKPYFHEHLSLSLIEARRRAQDFVTLMVERSGLLYETPSGYQLGDHLTMQEFLAAYYVAENYADEDLEGYVTFFQERARRSWWREVVLLAAGYLGQKPGFQGRTFLRRIVKAGGTQGQTLEALALAGRGLAQLRVGRPPDWYPGLADAFANRLHRLLYDEPVDAPIAARQEAGLVLGRLYGMPGDETGVGDPRFTGPQGLPDFVEIPAGDFWMGSDDSDEDDERPRHKVVLSAYEVAKYPTTNAMFSCFVADGGYADARWWVEAIEDGYWQEGAGYRYGNLPRYWDDDRWNNPSQPVVGVSRYEAVAYCRWLTAAVDDDCVYRLPTEAEWERAARGSAGWAYPWGDKWQVGVCNSEEVGLEQTSPVGLFPEGSTPEGVCDMVGNVYEWCRDWYAEDAYAESQLRNPTGPDSGRSRVLRGGYWGSNGPSVCRCGYRYGNLPRLWGYNWGFRCVRTLS